MIRRYCLVLLIILCGFFVALQAGDVKVTMKSGSTIIGELKELIATDHVTIIIAGVESVISMDDVSSIEKMNSVNTEILGSHTSKLVYGQYQITDTKQYPDSFILKIGDQELTMILIRGGWFNMGYDDRHSLSWDTEPIHRVSLSSFYVCKQLLSSSIIDRLKKKNKPSNNKSPHSFESRKGLNGIIEEIVNYTHAPFRLITEAEWEYTSLMPIANIIFGNKQRAEWCFDYWAEFTPADQVDPKGPSGGNCFVLRSYAPDNNKWKRIKSDNEDYLGNKYARIAISADQIKQ